MNGKDRMAMMCFLLNFSKVNTLSKPMPAIIARENIAPIIYLTGYLRAEKGGTNLKSKQNGLYLPNARRRKIEKVRIKMRCLVSNGLFKPRKNKMKTPKPR